MFQENIINCPELFIEILRFISDIQEDLLSLILINKQCHEIIEEKNSIFYQLLCKDRLDYEMFINLKQEKEEENNETIINWKEQFLEIVLFSWSECLQTTLPFTQIKEQDCENISVKCIDNGCLLISSDKETNDYYRNIRSKYPILKDITLHYYIKHLKQEIKHYNDNFLLFGVMNEQICNAIVRMQRDYTYIGEIILMHDKNLFSFNTSYASNGYICGYEKNERKASEFKEAWDVMQVISVEVKGIKDGNVVIKYYLNDKLIYELKDVLKGVDVINCKENRLYFGVSFNQSLDNFNNTVVIASTQKLSEDNLLNQFIKIQKKYKGRKYNTF